MTREPDQNLLASRRHDTLFRLLGVPSLAPEVRDAWRDFIEEVGKERRTLRIVHRIAVDGVGPGTSPEVALSTIAAFIEKRVTDGECCTPGAPDEFCARCPNGGL